MDFTCNITSPQNLTAFEMFDKLILVSIHKFAFGKYRMPEICQWSDVNISVIKYLTLLPLEELLVKFCS